MKRIVILGAGTAGTMMLNKLHKRLDTKEWEFTIIDQDEMHYYQPGFLFIPFDIYERDDVIKPKKYFLPPDARLKISPIDHVDPESKKVHLSDGEEVPYDFLIIATGTDIRPDEIEGMKEDLWKRDVFDFYTLDGAVSLSERLKNFKGGRLVLNIAEMPIKCPVAPLEFIFLADDYFKKRGIRDKVDLEFVTPLSGAFTKPIAAKHLGRMMEDKNIHLTTDFNIGQVDNDEKKIVSWDEREVPFDLLVTIPTNMGDDYVMRSEMGDELNFIPTDPHTLRHKTYEDIFVLGDATDLPTSKAGSVAHFEAEILEDNFIDVVEGRECSQSFDGHANCFIESGGGKGIMIDFNYDVEPLPGKYPWANVGPFSLLKETKMNHYGKLFFKWVYWNLLLPGRQLPLESQMTMNGKIQVDKEEEQKEQVMT